MMHDTRYGSLNPPTNLADWRLQRAIKRYTARAPEPVGYTAPTPDAPFFHGLKWIAAIYFVIAILAWAFA